ncbi:MAG TPA: type IX secretion system sortase PorU [Flavisolibacter sp.]|nr:type IX secretion system sortase PorU [Flavisolibacter sp.]
MQIGKIILILNTLLCAFLQGQAQRTYKNTSVLATGNWYKISVSSQGIFKIDPGFLSSLGISGNIPSAQIRLFGKRQAHLPESNGGSYTDDLEELAIQVIDGGDGVLNGSDHVLFYSPGPHSWITDTPGRRFIHKKNLYTEKVYYYVSVGGQGKRIGQQTSAIPSGTVVSSFDERYFHESDSVNFLASGKEWFGEEMSALPGKNPLRQFTVPAENAVPGTSLLLISDLAGRSVNAASRFSITLNNQASQELQLPAVGALPYDLFARQERHTFNTTLSQNIISITYRFTPGGFNAQGWLNWFELFYRKQLILPASGTLFFRDWTSVGNGTATFRLQNADANTQVWNISDPMQAVQMQTSLNGTILQVTNDATLLHEYVAIRNPILAPQAVGKVPNQNLHGTTDVDYIIVTHPNFIAQAQRLAGFHQKRNGLRTIVVTTEQVYHEFSGGIADPVAIRDYVKMYYDRYRSTWQRKYLLLFGRASFDYKERVQNNTNFVPAYESLNSLDPVATYTSDDFFGFLEDHEDINATILINTLDIGIGRIPARNVNEATQFVNKLEAYHAPASFGPWRTHLNFVADDEDFNLHLQDAEMISGTVATVAPLFNVHKFYLDAYRQESGAAGSRYPQANTAINNAVFNGTLIWNYSGHGSNQRLAEEVVLDQQAVNTWNNAGKLPLLITATCDFAPFDQPNVKSLGEDLLLRPLNGAIALMTTTRLVFANSNRIMNNNYLQFALQDSSGYYKTLGEAIQTAKNFTYQNSTDLINNRKFALLGDPAMRLGFPEMKVSMTQINGRPITPASDTIRAMEMVVVEGEVRNVVGELQQNFNGTVYLSVFDKPQSYFTLANDPTSQPISFQQQIAAIFKGKVTATGGRFQFRFRLPKDIQFQYGPAKFSLYAHDDKTDGSGYNNDVILGGIAATGITDKEGPEIKAYLNDERFVNGSITNAAPVLLLHLSDSSGINTGVNGIGHDILATLDNDPNQYFILNPFYEAALDHYQKGTLRFQLPVLKPGTHTLKIKAWDVVNNSNEQHLDFTVVSEEELRIDHVLNYPNPFTTRTAFWFEHNQPGIPLQVSVEIFTVAGKLIKRLSHTIITEGNRSSEVEWDGRDEYGDNIGRGVYLYRLTVKTADGKKASKFQRLVLMR